MRFYAFLLFSLISSIAIAQQLSDSLKIEMYQKSIKSHFDTFKKESPDIHFVKDTTIGNLSLKIADYHLVLVDSLNIYTMVKKGNLRSLHQLYAEQKGSDTLDIIIISRSVSYKRAFKFKKIEGKRRLITGRFFFAVNCRGGAGNIPDARFIFNPESQKWDFYHYNELYDLKLSEEGYY